MATTKVLRRFKDLQTGDWRDPGDEFACSDQRAAEIAERLPGYIEYTESGQGDEPLPDLSKLKLAELKALAKERGLQLPKNPTKAQVIEAIEA